MADLLPQIDVTIDEGEAWVGDLAERLDGCSRGQAREALRAALHALRDRISILAVRRLAGQLPGLLRGVFLEGWRPDRPPLKERSVQAFAVKFARQLPRGIPYAPNAVAYAGFEVIATHLDAREARTIAGQLPPPLRALWPPPAA